MHAHGICVFPSNQRYDEAHCSCSKGKLDPMKIALLPTTIYEAAAASKPLQPYVAGNSLPRPKKVHSAAASKVASLQNGLGMQKKEKSSFSLAKLLLYT